MSSSQTTTTNGAVVITHVYPYGNGMGVAGVASAPHCLGQTVSSVLGSFRAGHPKALGTIQIMIGLIMLLTGIVMTAGPQVDNIGVLSGIFVWGSIIYVVAGSLTVAADNKLNKCLVKGSLGMNVVATVTALTGTILHSLDSAVMYNYYCDYPDYPSYYPPSYFNYTTSSVCQQYWIRSQGISGVLTVFSLLEFIVSICVSSFACRAVCLCCRSTPETGNYPKGLEGDGMGTGFQQNHLPPQYTAVIP
ncbi:membrane-spanning 4-domains subfamily A member 4A isoform X2 [Oncorhynchus kisutch]|uniref:membrane-spanning 4-domains subfamily A member 4A isoform X2 n=1 Tax=Oncorhynchus kisutch TaxID=8019 RepID=UPI0012DC1A8C|nr:membrane-spanning 4-domains subfamily A member 4A isoform X2 [Oncorhynchus kisutch]